MKNGIWEKVGPNVRPIREALARGSRYVYARADEGGGFRMFQLRVSGGVPYGRALSDGRWMRITEWQLR